MDVYFFYSRLFTPAFKELKGMIIELEGVGLKAGLEMRYRKKKKKNSKNKHKKL